MGVLSAIMEDNVPFKWTNMEQHAFEHVNAMCRLAEIIGGCCYNMGKPLPRCGWWWTHASMVLPQLLHRGMTGSLQKLPHFSVRSWVQHSKITRSMSRKCSQGWRACFGIEIYCKVFILRGSRTTKDWSTCINRKIYQEDRHNGLRKSPSTTLRFSTYWGSIISCPMPCRGCTQMTCWVLCMLRRNMCSTPRLELMWAWPNWYQCPC